MWGAEYPEDGKGPRLPELQLPQYELILNLGDFLEDILIDGSSAVIYGESNTGKSFLALDLALHIACGKPWFGHAVEPGNVLYCALEGGFGFNNRVCAWKQAHKTTNAPFWGINSQINLLGSTDPQRIIDSCKGHTPVRLIVVDTLARAMAGGNENSPEDMGALVRNMDMIREKTGACFLFIHHCGKDLARGARGHSSLRAAIDTEIEVTEDEATQMKTATIVKQRELTKTLVLPFKLEQITLGFNGRGKPVTSCVVRQVEDQPKSSLPPLTGHKARALEILTNLLAEKGRRGMQGVPSLYLSVHGDEWRNQFYVNSMPGDTQTNRQVAFFRASKELISGKYVGMANNYVWVV